MDFVREGGGRKRINSVRKKFAEIIIAWDVESRRYKVFLGREGVII